MSEENKHIDELIRQKLDGFEITPPTDVWSKTQAEIGGGANPLRFWFFLTGGIVLAAILGYCYASSRQNLELAKIASKNIETSNNVSSVSSGDDKNQNEFNTDFKNEANFNTLADAGALVKSVDGEDLFSSVDDLQSSRLGDGSLDSSRKRKHFSDATSNNDRSRVHSNSGNDNTSRLDDITLNSSKERKLSPGVDANNDQDRARSDNGNDNSSSEDTFTLGSSTERKQSSSAISNGDKSKVRFNNGDEPGFNFDSISSSSNLNTILKNGNSLIMNNSEGGQKNTDEKNKTSSLFSSLPLNVLQSNFFQTEKNMIVERVPSPSRKNILNRLSFDISAGLSSYKIAPDKSASSNLSALLDTSSHDKLSRDFSLGINYAFWRKLSVHSGLEYSKLSETISKNDSTLQIFTYLDTVSQYYDSLILDTVYLTVSLSDTSYKVGGVSENIYKLISIPFGITWTQKISARSDIEFRFGGVFSIYSKYEGQIVADEFGGSILASEAYKTSGVLSLSGGLRYVYRFLPKHSLYIEPWVSRGISVFNSSSVNYSTRMLRGGLRLGYRIQL